MSCCKFWPDELDRSVKYGYLMVNHTATTAKPDWGMTTLQVLGKSEVQATSTLLKFNCLPKFYIEHVLCEYVLVTTELLGSNMFPRVRSAQGRGQYTCYSA